MLTSHGYPGHYEKGKIISGLEKVDDEVLIFPAGAVTNERGEVVTSGGRVMALTAFADTISLAAEKAEHAAETVTFDGKYFRRDIADDVTK